MNTRKEISSRFELCLCCLLIGKLIFVSGKWHLKTRTHTHRIVCLMPIIIQNRYANHLKKIDLNHFYFLSYYKLYVTKICWFDIFFQTLKLIITYIYLGIDLKLIFFCINNEFNILLLVGLKSFSIYILYIYKLLIILVYYM